MSNNEMVEGSFVETKSVKRRIGVAEEDEKSGGIENTAVVRPDVSSLPGIAVSMGRTVSRGNFEFARVNYKVEARLKDESEASDTFEGLRAYIEEELEREVALIRKSGRLPQHVFMKFIDNCCGVNIFVEYGLTINLKKYESAKIDISAMRPVPEDGDLAETMNSLRNWVGKRISGESKEIRRKLTNGGK